MDHDLPSTGSEIKLHKDRLLPGAQRKAPAHDGDREGWADEGRPDVGGGIVVSPGLRVSVVVGRRDEAVQHLLEVLKETVFVLEGREGAGGSDRKEMNSAFLDLGGFDEPGQFPGEVHDVLRTTRLDRQLRRPCGGHEEGTVSKTERGLIGFPKGGERAGPAIACLRWAEV